MADSKPAAPCRYRFCDQKADGSESLRCQVVNYVIGAKGAGVSALQEATGTRIQIQRAQEVPPGAATRSVKISGGDAERRFKCAQLIQSKVIECQERDHNHA